MKRPWSPTGGPTVPVATRGTEAHRHVKGIALDGQSRPAAPQARPALMVPVLTFPTDPPNQAGSVARFPGRPLPGAAKTDGRCRGTRGCPPNRLRPGPLRPGSARLVLTTRKVWKTIARRHRWALLGAIGVMVLGGVANTALPLLSGRIVDRVAAGVTAGEATDTMLRPSARPAHLRRHPGPAPRAAPGLPPLPGREHLHPDRAAPERQGGRPPDAGRPVAADAREGRGPARPAVPVAWTASCASCGWAFLDFFPAVIIGVDGHPDGRRQAAAARAGHARRHPGHARADRLAAHLPEERAAGTAPRARGDGRDGGRAARRAGLRPGGQHPRPGAEAGRQVGRVPPRSRSSGTTSP